MRNADAPRTEPMHGTGRRRWACCGRRERRGDHTRRGRRDRRVPCAPPRRGHGAARGIGDEERSMALTLVLGSDEQRRHLEARGQGARWEKGDDLALHARDAGGVVTAQLGVLVQGCRVGRVRARDATPRVRRTRVVGGTAWRTVTRTGVSSAAEETARRRVARCGSILIMWPDCLARTCAGRSAAWRARTQASAASAPRTPSRIAERMSAPRVRRISPPTPIEVAARTRR